MTNEAAAISPVEVTQEDRAAAADLAIARGAMSERNRCDAESGKWDDWNFIQAFARHRFNTTRSPVLSDEQARFVEKLRRGPLMSAGETWALDEDANAALLNEAADLIEALSRSPVQEAGDG
jgi:hypothetical protein